MVRAEKIMGSYQNAQNSAISQKSEEKKKFQKGKIEQYQYIRYKENEDKEGKAKLYILKLENNQ